MNTHEKYDFDYDVIDKRIEQISSKLLTPSDRLIYSRMYNEYRFYGGKPGGYTPSLMTLAVVGCYADKKPVMGSLKRLEEIGLIVRMETKRGLASRFLVRTINEALSVNPDLLSQPSMQERRAVRAPLEKRGYPDRKSQLAKSSGVVLKTMGCSPQDNTGVVLKTMGCSPQDTHERDNKEKEREVRDQTQKPESQNTSSLILNGTEQKKGEATVTERSDKESGDKKRASVPLNIAATVSLIGSKGFDFPEDDECDICGYRPPQDVSPAPKRPANIEPVEDPDDLYS